MKILIVGGVAGGASAATRARRLNEDAEIVVFERGEHISFANCGLPYHIGGVIEDRDRLLVTSPQIMKGRYNIDIRVRSEVLKIDPKQKTLLVKDLASGKEYSEQYDYLVLSPGAAPITPPIPGIDSDRVFSLRNLEDMDRIKAAAAGIKSATVVGGGYIGLEMAEALRELGLQVVLVELASQVMGPADPEMTAMLHAEIRLNAVDLRLGQSVSEIKKLDKGLEVLLSNGDKLDTDLVIMAVGVKPENYLAKEAGLEIGKTGGIKVDSHMQTSDKYIYAVGDAVEVVDLMTGQPALIPLAGPASRQGRIAVDNIMGKKSEYGHTQGTSICKIFDLTFAMTGLSEKQAKKNNIACDKVYIHPASHASYYPGANSISLKMIYDPKNGRVLGAQAVGMGGVDKCINVLAVAVRMGMTAYDLEELELVYAPPYGSAKDPVNYAGFVAANILRNDAEHFHADEIEGLDENHVLLDVRSAKEIKAGKIPGAVVLSLNELRARLAELDKKKKYMIYCRRGLKGYVAYRILKQNGFAASNLDGGYKAWCMYRQDAEYDKTPLTSDTGV